MHNNLHSIPAMQQGPDALHSRRQGERNSTGRRKSDRHTSKSMMASLSRNRSTPFEKTVENEWKIEAAYGGNEGDEGIFVRGHIFSTARLSAVSLICCRMWKRHRAIRLASDRFALTKGRLQVTKALEMPTHSALQKS